MAITTSIDTVGKRIGFRIHVCIKKSLTGRELLDIPPVYLTLSPPGCIETPHLFRGDRERVLDAFDSVRKKVGIIRAWMGFRW